MKLIASSLAAAILSLSLVGIADAAPRKLPVLTPASTQVHMVSVRHNHIKLQLPVRRGNY